MQVLLSLWLPLSAMGFSPSFWPLHKHQAAALGCCRAAVLLQGRANFMAGGELHLHSKGRVARASLKTRPGLFLTWDAVKFGEDFAGQFSSQCFQLQKDTEPLDSETLSQLKVCDPRVLLQKLAACPGH